MGRVLGLLRANTSLAELLDADHWTARERNCQAEQIDVSSHSGAGFGQVVWRVATCKDAKEIKPSIRKMLTSENQEQRKVFQASSTLSARRVIPRAPHRRAGCLQEFPKFAIVQGAMSSVKATQLRPGMVVQHQGRLSTVFSVDHRTPGNKRGSMQIRTGTLERAS